MINTFTNPNRARRPLLHTYPSQARPQHAFVSIDLLHNFITADWNPEIGTAIPSSVYRGRVRRYGIPSDITTREIRALLNRLSPIADRVVAGAEEEWDGQNMRWYLNDEARAAEQEIIDICEDLTMSNVLEY